MNNEKLRETSIGAECGASSVKETFDLKDRRGLLALPLLQQRGFCTPRNGRLLFCQRGRSFSVLEI
jgi:hypothetical protein